jgi:anti-sigma B factor antagonist
MINGMPVVTTPAEIDAATADQLRAALLHAGGRGHTTIVVDMTRTRFCDSAAVHALIAAHKRVLAEGGGLRLVVPRGRCRPPRLDRARQ